VAGGPEMGLQDAVDPFAEAKLGEPAIPAATRVDP
jgi:hypothetical protein